jgi:hypothetical protein
VEIGITAVAESNFCPPGKILIALTKALTNLIIFASSIVEKEDSMMKKHRRIRIKPV